MNWIVISLGILVVLLVYVLYRYFYITYSTLTTLADLKNQNKAITSIDKSSNPRYAYGIWVYINNLSPDSDVIFSRANNLKLYMDENSPILKCDLYTRTGTWSSAIITNNFPIQKWRHVIVSVDGQFVDYYINGKLIKSEKKNEYLASPPDVSVTTTDTSIYLGNSGTPGKMQTPFDAYISNFQRWTDPIDPQTAWTTYLAGNGQSNQYLSSYNVNFQILKNNVQQATFSLY